MPVWCLVKWGGKQTLFVLPLDFVPLYKETHFIVPQIIQIKRKVLQSITSLICVTIALVSRWHFRNNTDNYPAVNAMARIVKMKKGIAAH